MLLLRRISWCVRIPFMHPFGLRVPSQLVVPCQLEMNNEMIHSSCDLFCIWFSVLVIIINAVNWINLPYAVRMFYKLVVRSLTSDRLCENKPTLCVNHSVSICCTTLSAVPRKQDVPDHSNCVPSQTRDRRMWSMNMIARSYLCNAYF